jgi:hypothetical protein
LQEVEGGSSYQLKAQIASRKTINQQIAAAGRTDSARLQAQTAINKLAADHAKTLRDNSQTVLNNLRAEEARARAARAVVQEQRAVNREQRAAIRFAERPAARGRARLAEREPTGAGAVFTGTLASQAAIQAARFVARQAVEGAKALDIGDTGLAIRQLGAERRKMAEDLISGIGMLQEGRPGGQLFNRAQITQLFNESFGVVREGASQMLPGLTPEQRRAYSQEAMRGAQYLTDQTLETARLLVAMGKSTDDARESAISYSKALEAQDWLTAQPSDVGKFLPSLGLVARPEDVGKFDVKRAQEAFDFQRQLIPVIGKEMTGEFYRQQIKYLRSARFAMTPEAIAVTMFAAEEMGTSAAVGMSQMVKQLVSTQATKQARQAQVELGLRPAITAPPTEAALARKDPLKYLTDVMIPLLKQRRGLTEEQLGDPTVIGELADKYLSERTAKEAFTNLMLRRQEYVQQLADLFSRKGDVDTLREATKPSLVVGAEALSNQFQSVLGSAVQLMQPGLSEAMQTVSGGLAATAERMQKARKEGVSQEDINTLALGGLGAILAAPIAKKGLGLLATGLGAVAQPLGLAAGVQGMMAKEPATRSLAAAGVSLLAAGNSLQGAAGSLTLVEPRSGRRCALPRSPAASLLRSCGLDPPRRRAQQLARPGEPQQSSRRPGPLDLGAAGRPATAHGGHRPDRYRAAQQGGRGRAGALRQGQSGHAGRRHCRQAADAAEGSAAAHPADDGEGA